ncbi:AraC family transcriptional regulator [Paenibacillus rhizovicinus]|uniref:AraC family transcriptional regulator n=1 Tax=Paenibacillus rhizovicinus TaxID=2704463 RepID=A0A6C0P6L7_9BACL|nr:AraC family transcriptional regulator [Paenibacillus rhizovicinus]QHW33986.1 AraC family transcriptional regulator [Paenibacillus rhizovicinus]
MQAIHKRFEDSDNFPFSLVYKDTKSPQRELPDHLHDWHELIYVYAGKGTLFINHAFYDMRPGDVFLIPGNTVHRAFPDERTPVTSSALFFAPSLIQPMNLGESYSLLRCFEQARKRKQYKLETSAAERETIARLLDDSQREGITRLPNYRVAILIRIHELLLTVNRMAVPESAAQDEPGGAEPVWMRSTLTYIDAHLGDADLKLADLSRRAAITPSHFSRVFKQLTGMNVTDYVVVKRIMLSKELLLRTDDSIGAICAQCGFDSESYFYKKFKQMTGMTPSAYKRGERGG